MSSVMPMYTFLRRSLLSLALLSVPAFTMTGCNLLGTEDDPLAFAVPFTFTFPAELPIVYPTELISGGQVAADSQSVPLHFLIPMPSIPELLPGGGLSNSEVITRVEIVSITATIDNNTLNIPIEPIQVRVGDSNDTWATAILAAETAQLPAGFTGEEEGDAVAANQENAGALLANGGAKIGFGTEWLLNEGDIPEGRAGLRLSIKFRAIVSPLGAANQFIPGL
jgi:hypothetical protein